MEKRGQLSVFIIVGIVVVVGLVAFFVFKGKIIPSQFLGREINPDSFFEACLGGKVREGVDLMLTQGGYIEPRFSFRFKFEGEDYHNISYLCYNENFYIPCINQEPMLITHLEREMEDYINEDVKECFQSYISTLEKASYEVDSNYEGFEVVMTPKKMNINIEGEITYEKAGETSKQKNFEVTVPTMFYDLAVIVQEILSQEGEYCNFEQVGFMLFNPEFELDKFKTGDSKTIYTLKSRKSEEAFRFAIRGCAIPPGM